MKNTTGFYILIDFTTLYEKKLTSIELQKLVKNEDFFALPKGFHPQRQSKLIDKILGYKISKIEQKYLRKYRAYDCLYLNNGKKHFEGTQAWIGLAPQALQTPYSEILSFLKYFIPHQPKIIVDLGAAYGRVGIVLKAVFPEASFIGFEVMKERIDEARRVWNYLKLDNCSIVEQNILESEFEIPKADVYFIYDFSEISHVRLILNKFKERLHGQNFFIVARGDGICSLLKKNSPDFWNLRDLIEQHDWIICSSKTSVSNLSL